ncbi:phage head spike fiber domain-containing protein [Rhodovulum kholense]|uniref:Uncharacterized protein n=1 Tax=Rhodovulum kholense TaxID=453584 RepID=A0A8E3AP54_9RHOB|nr:hypothetical protein [Rhodovulum kholense]PTW43891.1 hypothetical protein C8N38_12031 [Rhodovulum kholense]
MAVTYTPGHAAASPYPMTHARILWDRLTGTVSATSAAEGFEAALAATVETNSWWQPVAAPASWQIEFASAQTVDAIGIGAHTLGSSGASARVEYLSGSALGNLLLYSQDFALWPTLTGAILGAAFAPDGSTDARWLTEDTSTGAHYLQSGFTAVAGRTYTLSVYMRPSASRRLRLALVGPAYATPAFGDVGADGQFYSTSGTTAVSSIPVGSTGWFRVSISATAQASGTANVRFALLDAAGNSSYTGTVGSIRIFGAQAEWRTFAAPYIRSLSTSATSYWWAVSDDWLLPSDNSAILHLFAPVSTLGLRLSISKVARIGVIGTGLALAMPRRGYTDLGMIDLGRSATLTSHVSEGGQLMGRFLQRSGLSGSFAWQNLSEDWYRATFDPFARAARTEPFWIAARPEGYPTDCAYAWVDDVIAPSRQGRRNFVSVGFTATGHADAAA